MRADSPSDLVVERDQPVAQPDVGFGVRRTRCRRVPHEIVNGAVLMEEPRDLVRMADEVGRELRRDHDVDSACRWIR